MAWKQARASPNCQQCYEQHRDSRNQRALFRRRLWRGGSERRFANERLGSRNHGRWCRPLEQSRKVSGRGTVGGVLTEASQQSVGECCRKRRGQARGFCHRRRRVQG